LRLGVFVGFVLLWIASLIFRLFVNIASSYLSSVLSRLLNQATRTQLRKLSLASDTIGEAGIVARHCPPWVTAPYKPLPQDLSDEIAKAADAAAALSIAKFRAALGTLVFTDQKTSVPDVIGEYLTWQELVHTSYFDVSRFRKLIACAISQVRGFEATSAFQADPDHLIVAGWYANLTTRQLADDT
jgi:hypothetical protein